MSRIPTQGCRTTCRWSGLRVVAHYIYHNTDNNVRNMGTRIYYSATHKRK